MFDFRKEATFAHAMGEFFTDLEERLADRDSYGLADWYADLAWGMRLLVSVNVPLFSGKNENTWLTLADELDSRASFYAGNLKFITPWAGKVDGDVTWRQSVDNLVGFINYSKTMFTRIQTEDADFSGPLPDGERGVNLGEALKMCDAFTRMFWKQELRWSRTPSPYKSWLRHCTTELTSAYKALDEPTHGGDLGDPNATHPGGAVPWSWAGQ